MLASVTIIIWNSLRANPFPFSLVCAQEETTKIPELLESSHKVVFPLNFPDNYFRKGWGTCLTTIPADFIPWYTGQGDEATF